MTLRARRKVNLEPVNTSAKKEKSSVPSLPITKATINDFETKESLGHGSQSIVYRVVKKDTGEVFALKKIKLLDDPKELQNIVTDVYCLNILRHPNIVRIYSAFFVDEHLQILMGYNDGLSLADYLRFTPTMPEPALGRLVWYVLQGLSYLRRNHYLHRDLKPSNILLSKSGEVKIADFGMARHLSASIENAQSFIGTWSYMAPERINNKFYSFKSDIWSLGMITYQCALGAFPYPGDSSTLNFWDLQAFVQKDISVNLSSDYSSGCKDFITDCLKVDPELRAAVEELVQHPWVLLYSNESADKPLQDWILQNERKREAEKKSLNSLNHAGISPGH